MVTSCSEMIDFAEGVEQWTVVLSKCPPLHKCCVSQ